MRAEVGRWPAAACRPRGVVDQHAHDQLAVGAGLQPDIVDAHAHALHDLALRVVRHQLRRIIDGGAHDLAVGLEDGQLQRAGLAAQIVQGQRQRGGGAVLDAGQQLRLYFSSTR
jgi:hypothetical protein